MALFIRTPEMLTLRSMSASFARVLLVDDELSIRLTTRALLEDDYYVREAASGKEALRVLNERRFDVICTDYRMPGMTGVELLREAQKLHPAASGIIVTAYADYPEYQDSFREIPCLVLLKPYEPARLSELVARSAKLAKMKLLTLQANSQTDLLAVGMRGR
jgi:two-component system response regulator HupR/HoxA